MPQHPVATLTEEESRTLATFVHRGKANERTLNPRAHPVQISRVME